MDRLGFEHGLHLFNADEFYEAHEVWEDVWRPLSPSRDKQFLQGLIQIAVGLHHHSTGNCVGALSLLKRGTRNIRDFRTDFLAIDVDGFLEQVIDYRDALSEGRTLPPPPKIAKLER